MKKCQKPSAKVAETIFPHHSQMRSSDVVVVVVGTLWNKFGGNNNNCGCVNQVTASPFTLCWSVQKITEKIKQAKT